MSDIATIDRPPIAKSRLGRLFEGQTSIDFIGRRKVGLAIALFDAEDRLLAVASGGSKLASIKPGRRKTFTLDFDGVFAEANRAVTFQVSLEPKN